MMDRKTGLIAVAVLAMCLCGGCSADGTVDESEARRWYEEMKEDDLKDTAPGGGVHSTKEDLENNTDRNTYGMQTDNNDSGMDMRDMWEDLKQ